MAEFRMPSLGADMEAGTLFEWRVQPGDTVRRGDIIADVETVKGVIEVEVFADGVVEQLLVKEGQEVPVGTVLAIIRGADEPVGAAGHRPMAQPRPAVAAAQPAAVGKHNGGPPSPPDAPAPRRERRRVSPLARRRAVELGVDLQTVSGSGPAGAISLSDVEAAAQASTPPVRISPVARRLAADLGVDLGDVSGSGPHGAIVRRDVEATAYPPEKRKPAAPGPPDDYQAGMRRAIAAAMTRANREIPHYYLETRIDMSRALQWLAAENLKRPITDRLLPAVLLLKSVAHALRDVPALNGYWQDDALHTSDAIHIGFAIALRQGGLITPAIHHVDRLDLDGLMAALRDLITRTRGGRLRSSELTDATVTVTSLGDLGVEKVFGVIYPPQVALVGFGKIGDQVWVESGMLGIRPTLIATLSGDHRASDGRTGGQFLDALNKHLQEPQTL